MIFGRIAKICYSKPVLTITNNRRVIMDIVTRSEAAAMGFKRYYTGVPCAHGHDSPRYVCNTGCIACHNPQKRVKSAAEFWTFTCKPMPAAPIRRAALRFMREQGWHMKALEYLLANPTLLRKMMIEAKENMP